MADSAAAQTVFTVGHSDRDAEVLVALLQAAGVEVVADVRTAPWSRRHPQFARSPLERALGSAGLRYVWLGAGLGGLRAEGYDAYRRTPSYRAALDDLAALARAAPTVVMCAEREPAHCHRRFIADDLAGQGFTVVHLIDERTREGHQGALAF